MKPQMLTPFHKRWRPRKKAPRILCVHDNGGMRDVICQVLSFAGFHCETVIDGEAALERIMEESAKEVDVLITDHDMPRLSGLNLVKELRKRGFNQKIVVHSPWLRAEELAAYEALRVDAILTKPFDASALLQTISELCQNRTATAAGE
jgi:CheY-like chemotaxis protein